MLIPEAMIGSLLQQLVFNFDFLDLVLWWPKLSLGEFAATAAVVSAWKLLCDGLDRMCSARLRVLAADGLLWLAARVRPV